MFEKGAIKWLDNFGASKPEFAPLEVNSLEKKRVQPMKEIAPSFSDDVA